MTTCGELRDLIPLRSHSVLEQDEEALVAEHLKTCEGCRALAAEGAEAVAHIAAVVDAPFDAERTFQRVMETIAKTRDAPPIPASPSLEALDEALRRGERPPLDRALDLVARVARAVHHAREDGVVYRPVVGPHCMSPEEARGDLELDARADVWSLGVVLYELLCGRPPFEGETTVQVQQAILERDPTPPSHLARVPLDVETVCLKALEKDPDRRYPTAAALADDLDRARVGETVGARPLSTAEVARRWARRNLASVAVAALAATTLSGSLGWVYVQNRDSMERARSREAELEWQTFATDVEVQEATARNKVKDALPSARVEPDGAIAAARAALKTLDDAGSLGTQYRGFPMEERTREYLAGRKGAFDEIRRSAWRLISEASLARGHADEAVAALDEALALGPLAGDAKLDLEVRRARALAMAGKLDSALQAIEALVELAPADPRVRLERGRLRMQAGRVADAIEDLRAAIAADPASKNVDARVDLGLALRRLGKNQEAMAELTKAVEIQPEAHHAFVARARTHLSLGQMDEALLDATEAIDLAPANPDPFTARGEIELAVHRSADAVKDFETAITRNAEHWPANIGLARALAAEGDEERAIAQAVSVERDAAAPPLYRAAALAVEGDVWLVRTDPVVCALDAEVELRAESKGSDAAPGPTPDRDVLHRRAQALVDLRAKNARNAYDKASELGKGGESVEGWSLSPYVAAHLGLARLELARGEARIALFRLAQARDASGDREPCEVSLEIGRAYLRLDDPGEAEKAFAHVLRLDPSCAFAVLGRALVVSRKKVDAELFAKGRALATIAPQGGVVGEDVSAFLNGASAGRSALESLKPELLIQAVHGFARAIVADPFNGSARVERARVLAGFGLIDLARSDLDQAIEVDPTLREAFEMKGLLLASRDPGAAAEAFERAVAVAATPDEAVPARFELFALGSEKDPAKLARELRRGMALASFPPYVASQSPMVVHALIEGFRACAARGIEGADAAARSLDAARIAESENALEAGRQLRDRRSYPAAIEKLTRAIELDPDYAGLREKPGHPAEPGVALYDRGTCYLKIGNFVPGILDFARSLEVNPRFADQFYNKVYQVSYVVDLNRVISELNQIVAWHPDKAHVVFLRGFFYVAKTEFKQFDEKDVEYGERDLTRAVDLNPRFSTALVYRGFLRFKRTQPRGGGKPALVADLAGRRRVTDAAIADYEAVRQLDPTGGVAWFLEAMAWSSLAGDERVSVEERAALKVKALDALERSFDHDFKGYDRIKAEKAFDPLRDEPRFQKLMAGK
jgi:tetratricopeptide (TPR) repeat protein